jgi:epoxide hydrolase-like predicted phosphatase
MYRLIIFDLFDVIHSDPFKRWLKKGGYKRGETRFKETSRLVDVGDISEQDFYKQLSSLSGQSLQSVQAVFNDMQLIDKDMVTLIDALHASYKTGLLSNASSEYARAIVAAHNLSYLFDEIVISAEVRHVKPSREIFDVMLDKMQLKPKDAIFIDDNKQNIKAAASLGIHSILFTDRGSLEKELHKLGFEY